MDAQQQHDKQMKGFRLSPGSRQRLEDSLRKKGASSAAPSPSGDSDLREAAMKLALTPSGVEELTAHGF